MALALVAGCGDDQRGPDFGTTIPCSTSADCPAELPMCEPLAMICVGCISGQMTCPNPSDVCDNSTHTCVPGNPNAPCMYNSDCAFPTPVCDVPSGKCVGCRSDNDCPDPSKPFCDDLFDGSTYTCLDNCLRCRGDLPVCQRDLGLCCDVDGGMCRTVTQ